MELKSTVAAVVAAKSDIAVPMGVGSGGAVLSFITTGIFPIIIGSLTIIYLMLKIYFLIKEQKND